MTGEPPIDDLFGPPPTKPPATRTDDHKTSQSAALAVEIEQHTIRAKVHRFAKEAGPDGFIDDDLLAAFPDNPESSYRKRRTELTGDGLIVDSGKVRRNRKGNNEVIWVHRDHTRLVPCPTHRNPEQWDQLRSDAKAMAADLEKGATQMMAEGRSVFGRQLAEAAAILRRLGA